MSNTPAMLNMFPKLALVATNTYLRVLAKVALPSRCLPGKHSFINEQVFGFQNQPITGNDIASIQDNNVTRNDLLDWDSFRIAIP